MKVSIEGKIREFTRYYFEENYTSRDNKSKKDSILSVTRKVVSKKIFQKSMTEATMSCFNEERKKRKKGKEEEKNNRPRYTFRIVFHRAAINSMDRGERRREVRADGREEREGKWKLKAVLRIKSTSRRWKNYSPSALFHGRRFPFPPPRDKRGGTRLILNSALITGRALLPLRFVSRPRD